MRRPEPTKNQVRAFNYCLKNEYSIVGMDPRLGKSRVAVGVQQKLKNNCLIICPGHLVPNWKKEIQKWHKDKNVQITMIRKGSDIYDVFDSDFVIVSYDLAQKAENFFEWADMVVIDEAHNIKNMDAKRTEFIHKNIFENSIKRVLLLTGTVLRNRVKEFYSLLAICFYNPNVADSQFLELYPSEIDFADRFSFRKEYVIEINGKFVTVVKWEGLRNVEELKTYLEGRYIRIKASEKDLPPITYNDILISEDTDHELLGAFNKFFGIEGNDNINPAIKAEAALKKVPFTIKYVNGILEQTDCAIIYTDHVASAEAIAKEFGVKAITGKVPAHKRSEMADAFQRGEGKVLVATVGALKEGRDLFRANDLIFNDYPWVPGDIAQVINRIRSLGKKNPCLVHRIFDSPQDEYILKVLQEKQLTIDQAT